MPKIELNLVAAAMKQAHVDPAKLREVIELLNLEANAQGDEETVPPVKKQFVVLVSDPEGKLPKDDFVAWAVKVEESVAADTTLDRIHQAAYDYNASRKGRMMPVKTVGGAIENVAAKYFKERGVWIATKEPVWVARTNNQIPTDDLKVVKGGSLE